MGTGGGVPARCVEPEMTFKGKIDIVVGLRELAGPDVVVECHPALEDHRRIFDRPIALEAAIGLGVDRERAAARALGVAGAVPSEAPLAKEGLLGARWRLQEAGVHPTRRRGGPLAPRP